VESLEGRISCSAVTELRLECQVTLALNRAYLFEHQFKNVVGQEGYTRHGEGQVRFNDQSRPKPRYGCVLTVTLMALSGLVLQFMKCLSSYTPEIKLELRREYSMSAQLRNRSQSLVTERGIQIYRYGASMNQT